MKLFDNTLMDIIVSIGNLSPPKKNNIKKKKKIKQFIELIVYSNLSIHANK